MMMKRFLSLTSIWLIIGCKPNIGMEISLVELVPQNTSVVAQINDSISLKNSNLLTKIFSLNDDLKKTIQNIIPENTPSPQVVFITPLGRNENVVGLICKRNPIDSVVSGIKTIKYSGKTIETIEKEGQTFYSTHLGHFKMLSQSQLVIENGIRKKRAVLITVEI